MKRLLLPLIAAFAFPTAASASDKCLGKDCFLYASFTTGRTLCTFRERNNKKVPDKSKDVPTYLYSILEGDSSIEEERELLTQLIRRWGYEDQSDWILNTRDGAKVVFAWADYYSNFPDCDDTEYQGKPTTAKLFLKHVKPVFNLIPKEASSAKQNKKSTEKVNQKSAHQKCLKAADYAGCMKYEKGELKSESNDSESNIVQIARKFNKGKDCLNGEQFCLGTGQEKDFLGMPTLKRYFYRAWPEENRVYYYGQAKDVKVRGQYGRYIHIKNVNRLYQNPKAGTPGSSTTIGSGSATCKPGLGTSLNCTTTPARTINFPGRAARPGGLVQYTYELIMDCKDRTFVRYDDGKRIEKWQDIGNGNSYNFLEKVGCPYVGNLEKSSFSKVR